MTRVCTLKYDKVVKYLETAINAIFCGLAQLLHWIKKQKLTIAFQNLTDMAT